MYKELQYMKKPSANLVNINNIIDKRWSDFFGKYGLDPNLLIVSEEEHRELKTDNLNYFYGLPSNIRYRGLQVKICKNSGIFVCMY